MPVVLRVWSLGLWLALALVASAQAQEVLSEPPAYSAAIDTALAEYELQHFAEARAQFQRAHDVYPNARTLRGLGMAEFELGNYGDSVAYLEAALASVQKPLEGALRERTQELLAQAEGYVARIRVASDPSVATVVVDGMPVELGAGGVLVLTVGDHVLEFRAQGHAPEKRALKVKGGERHTLEITMRPQADVMQAPPALEPRRPLYKNGWFWAGVGVVAAGAATATALALRAEDTQTAPGYGGSTGSVVGLP